MRSCVCCVAVSLFLVLLAGCSTSSDVSHGGVPVGWMDRGILEDPAYGDFALVYDTSHIHQDFVELIRQVNADVEVIVFLGAWCPDSRREVPRFMKIVDLTGMRESRVRLYGLDRSKQSSDGLTDRYTIERIPTFVFLKHGEEIGRIIEVPRATLEADVLSILAGAQQKR